ncbi:unnamed protein product [Ascophyllum nodosum]
MMSSFMRPKVTATAPASPPGPIGATTSPVFRDAEVVPLPQVQGEADGAISGGFMAKFQVHFPQTGNDNPARRIISRPHTDALGWTWRLVLHPWGHDSRGCYSAFLELANAAALPPGFSRYVKLEFALHGWDAAYQVQPTIRTHFLLHKFTAQATDFGYNRAFEHDVIMAQRTKYIDPQGFVRMSVKIADVREAFFRVATDVDLARSVTGQGGGGDFADWHTCLPAKAFKHDQLLYVIQKVAELTGVSLVSCRPWLCLPRPGGAIRPVAALLPRHLPMTICEALGDRNQYHIYLEEVDSLPDVWERRRSVPGDLPPEVAGDLLLAGRAYAQLPSEVYLVFLKIERRILLAYASEGRNSGTLEALPPSDDCGEPQFVFIGKAMAHKSDRGSELIPIARSLTHLPETINLEVFEQLEPEQVRHFSGDKTVAQAGLQHGSVLLFRGVPSPLAANASSSSPSASAEKNNANAAAAALAAAVERTETPSGEENVAGRAPPPSAAVGLLSLSSAIAAKTSSLVAIAPAPPSGAVAGPSAVAQETRSFPPLPGQGRGGGGGGGGQAAARPAEGVEVDSGEKLVLGEVKGKGNGEDRALGRQVASASGDEAFVPWAEEVAQRRTPCSIETAHREVNQEPARVRLLEGQDTNSSAHVLTATAAAKSELSKKAKEIDTTPRPTTTTTTTSSSSSSSSSSTPPSSMPERLMANEVDVTARAIDRTAGVGPHRTVSIAETLREGAPPKGTDTATPPVAAADDASAGVSMQRQVDAGDVMQVTPPTTVDAGPFMSLPEAIPTAPSRGAVSGEDTESDMGEGGEGAAPPEDYREERSDQQPGKQSSHRSEGWSDQRSEERSDQRSKERSGWRCEEQSNQRSEERPNQRSEERSNQRPEERFERGIEPSEEELEQPGRELELSEQDHEIEEDSEEQLEQPGQRCEQQESEQQQSEQQHSGLQQFEHQNERREKTEQGARLSTLVTDHAGGRYSSLTPRCRSASSSVTDHAGARDSSPTPRCQSALSRDATVGFPQQQQQQLKQQQQDSPGKRVTRARTGRTAPEEFEVSRTATETGTGPTRVEAQQRRSSRKTTPALTAARAQTRYSTRAVSRGGNVHSRGGRIDACSPRGNDGSMSPIRSAINNGDGDRASESSRSPPSRGDDVAGASKAKSSDRDRDKMVNLKRALEGGGEGRPRKNANTPKTTRTCSINESEAASQEVGQFFVGIDAIEMWRELSQVEGCNMDKILQLMRAAERIQIAKAIQSICSDGKDRWRANQLERLLTLRENGSRDSTMEPN